MAPVDVADENNAANELSELEEKIVQQIEYYFGDINIRRDKFMKEKMAENPNGWVPLETLLTFNRLKTLTTDPAVIVEAIKKSSSDVVEVSEDDKSLKRVHPISDLTEEQLKDLHLRTVHFKGFPLDTTLDAVKAFASQYGKVEAVEMRKTRLEKTFKGCCMVVFGTLADAEKAVEGKEIFTDAIPKFLRENKIDYFKRKAEYRRERMANRKKARFGNKDKVERESDKQKTDADAKAETKTDAHADSSTKDKLVVEVENGDQVVKSEDADMKSGDAETGAGDGNSRKRKHGGGGGRGRGKKFRRGGRRGGYKGGNNRNKGKNS